MKMKKMLSILLVVCILISGFCFSSFAYQEYYTEGPFTYYIENGYAVINDYDNSVTGELVIPQKLGGCQVGGITRWKFQHLDKITSVVLPEGFLFLGELVFNDCPNLRSVTIPDSLCGVGRAVFYDTPWYDALPKGDCIYIGNVLAELNDGYEPTELIVKEGTTGIADYLCNSQAKLTKVVLPESCVYIGEHAFSGCSALKEIKMPEKLFYLGAAFSSCGLESITIPDGIDELTHGIFSHDSSLKDVKLSSDIKIIRNGAFGLCTGLKVLEIPEGVEYIESHTFDGCTGLEEITIPVSMKTIDHTAFKDAVNLKKINFNGTEEQYAAIAIGANNEPLTKLKPQNTELQADISYIPYYREEEIREIPRGTSVADYTKAMNKSFEYFSSYVSTSLSEKGLDTAIIGDVDMNGTIEASDARTALRASVGLETVDLPMLYTADIDNNKKITASDARSILRASVKLEDSSMWV